MASRFEVYYINLDPTVGSEIKKARPCVIISPDEMNHHIATVIIAPLTSVFRNYPSPVPCNIQGKHGQKMLEKIRTVNKSRLVKEITILTKETRKKVVGVLLEMFAE